MKIPSNYTEQEVVAIIDKIAKILSSKFRFGYHDRDDMIQQGTLFACQAIASGKYDETRPLENFLFTHMRNRFINYKRDNYIRNEPPCLACPFYDPKFKKSDNQCAVFTDKLECEKFSEWYKRNMAKKNLIRPLDVSGVHEEMLSEDTNMEDEVALCELLDKIDEFLPVELRTDYLRMLAGQSIPKARKQHVRNAIIQILHEQGEIPSLLIER